MPPEATPMAVTNAKSTRVPPEATATLTGSKKATSSIEEELRAEPNKAKEV